MLDTLVETRRGMDPRVLTDILSNLVGKHGVPGAQLAVHEHGETVVVEVGELELDTGRRVTREAAFPIGSVSKSFTATLAMILVADGDLKLETPVGDYLPELRDLGDEVTVGRLLSHTSGLAADADSDDAAAGSVRRYVVDYCQPRLLIQEPGIGFSYSNLGYVLAGHLIETVTGMSWWEAMESVLLRPLGIDPSFIGSADGPGRPVATGHSVNVAASRARPVEQSLSRANAPAGGLAASATDLVALGLLHVKPGMPGLLPARNADRMRRVASAAEPFGIADGWASGLAAFRHGATEWFGHDGNGNGTGCYFRVDPEGGRIIAFTCNSSTGHDLWQDLLDELGRTGLPIGRHRTQASSRCVSAPSACVGSYTNGDLEFEVTAAEDGLLGLAIDGGSDRITCHDDLTFSMPDPRSADGGTSGEGPSGRFLLDPFTGRVDGIQIDGRLACRQTSQLVAA